MTGDANTDYNAAIALVKDASRQDDAMVAFQNFVKVPGFNLPAKR